MGDISAEAVAVVANMVEAALMAGAGDEGGAEDQGLASGAAGVGLSAPILAGAGAFNVRSTERQYALADEAAKLGWERERIVVIDGDLGISGRDAHAREGYKELVARVCMGEVGAIFGLEVSRLARSSADLPAAARVLRADRHHGRSAGPTAA